MALVSAVATLLAALFFCLGAGPGSGDPHHRAESAERAAAERVARTAPAAVNGAGVSGTAVSRAGVSEYVCPYDRGGCSLFPSLSPAVLGTPPLDPPPHAEAGAPRPDPPSGDGRAHRARAQPRAPDLHVLQVLRT
ncbi:hypothetical protein [Streptomyces sp. NPDC058664]|uniref:hypothetical protein n=1 Tax=unclassified Streptomyces TaxID=2593676 RepID=UPI0036468BEC